MREIDFKRKLVERLKKQFYVYSIETGGVSKGIPDLYIISQDEEGATWVELKAKQRIQKTAGGLYKIEWRAGQQDFMRRYLLSTQHVGCTLVHEDEPDSIFLIPGFWYDDNEVFHRHMIRFRNYMLDIDWFNRFNVQSEHPFFEDYYWTKETTLNDALLNVCMYTDEKNEDDFTRF